MQGGPSQLETFDPHPGNLIGGETKAIDTKVPGLQVAHLLPQTAEEVHELCVIRSMVSKEGDHERGTYLVKTGYRPDPTLTHPSLGAIVAHELPVAVSGRPAAGFWETITMPSGYSTPGRTCRI
jgi:uncharacterized protein DUF1501